MEPENDALPKENYQIIQSPRAQIFHFQTFHIYSSGKKHLSTMLSTEKVGIVLTDSQILEGRKNGSHRLCENGWDWSHKDKKIVVHFGKPSWLENPP